MNDLVRLIDEIVNLFICIHSATLGKKSFQLNSLNSLHRIPHVIKLTTNYKIL